MKHLLCHPFLIAMLMLFATSCSHSRYPQELIVADSLSNVDADSTDALLRRIEPQMMAGSEPVRMYCQLLRQRINDKLYIKPASDSMALALVEYYEHHGDRRFLPRAYYYAGRTYIRFNDFPQALSFYQKAEQAMAEYPDSTIESVVYAQMGYVFFRTYLMDSAISYFKKACESDFQYGDSTGVIYDYRDIANSYLKKKNYDSAYYYYDKAIDIARQSGNMYMLKHVRGQVADMFIEQKRYKEALLSLRDLLADHSESDRSGVYDMASRIYHALGKEDSAWYYYHKILEFGTVYAKQDAYRGLAQIALNNKDIRRAVYYNDMYGIFTDSIHRITASDDVARFNSLYNYHLREKEIDSLKYEKVKSENYILILILVSLVLIIGILSYIPFAKRRRRDYQRKIEALHVLLENKERESVEQIEKNQKKIDELSRQLETTNNPTEKQRIEYEQQVLHTENKKIEFHINTNQKAKDHVENSEVYHDISELLKERRPMLESHWKALGAVVNEAYGGFTERLFNMHKLKDHEYHVCLLIKSGFTPLQISVLTARTPQSISMARSRLFQKTFGRTGKPEDWDLYILSL